MAAPRIIMADLFSKSSLLDASVIRSERPLRRERAGVSAVGF